MKGDTTQIRITKRTNERLKAALKRSSNGMPSSELAETILSQAADQLERDKPAPAPLPIVELLRRQRGLGSADALRTLVENREELQSVVREEVQSAMADLGKKYEAMVEEARAEKKKRKAG